VLVVANIGHVKEVNENCGHMCGDAVLTSVKEVNENCGHMCGDAVLTSVAATRGPVSDGVPLTA